MVGVVMLVTCSFAVSVVYTIYADHQALVRENGVLLGKNHTLSQNLEWRKHDISTTDPVFSHIISILQAFQGYRINMKGSPCVIWITAPEDSEPLARAVELFSVTVSGCATLGPFPQGQSPDIDADVMNGMVPGVMVIHAPRGDKPAYALEMALTNQIPTRRSYETLKTPKARLYQSLHQYTESFLWLQFGTDMKWNSERYGKAQITGPGP